MDHKSIKILIENSDIRTINIPIFQRPYKWDKIQIDQFLNDFDNLIDSYQDEDDDTYHFFGLIVYVENSDREKTIDIIDGQQRITTIFILLN